MIPANDFCAPQNITQNITAIVDCARADQYSCGQWPRWQCAWREGKDVANNSQFDYGRLFESNFCHPPTTDNWVEQAPRCLNYTDNQSCASNQCVWSTGKELVPKNASFCNVEYISLNASDYAMCSQMNQSDCNGQCTWYGDQPSTNVTQPMGYCQAMQGVTISGSTSTGVSAAGSASTGNDTCPMI